MTLNPAPWRWGVGVQTAVAIALIATFWWVVGHREYGFIASLGAFTAFYGTTVHRVDRCKVLPWIGLGLIFSSAMGVACAGHEILTYGMIFLVVLLASLLTLSFRIGPPGPMMFALVAGVSAQLAIPAAQGGAGRDPLVVVLLVASGVIVAYLSVIAPLLLPAVRRREIPPLPLKMLLPFSPDRETWIVTARISVAVVIAMFLIHPLAVYRPHWVIVTIIGILQLGSARQLTTVRAIQRVLGTVLGIGVFVGLAHLQPNWVGLILIVSVLQGAAEVVIGRNYGLGLLFITPLALTIFTVGSGSAPALTMQGRVTDTLIGAAIALVVFWCGELLQELATRRAR